MNASPLFAETSSWRRDAARHRRLAVRSALPIVIMCGSFGVAQYVLFEPANAHELWTPLYARISAWLNIVGAFGVMLFYVLNRHLDRHDDATIRRYVTTLNASLIGSLFFCLGHMYLAGSHNSIVPLSLFIHLIVVHWFAPHRHIPYHVGLAIAAGGTLLALEYMGYVPYSPMLDRSQTLVPIFLDWRWTLGDLLMFFAMATPSMMITSRVRHHFERREQELQVLVDEQTRELRASHADLEKQIEAVRQANEALATADRVRTAQAESMASLREHLARATRAATLGEIVGSIAHQMTQPLAGVLANAQAAALLMDADSPDMDEIRSAIADIIDDERRAEAIIQSIRSLAQEAPSAEQRVVIDQVVERTSALVATRMAQHDIGLTVHRGGRDAVVIGDPIQLSQLVLNLLSNAIDALATRDREDASEVTATVSRDDDSVVIDIADNGPGFDQTNLSEVFHPWVTFRADGMGLGLALVRRIALAHGGLATAENSSLGGARVIVRLPAARRDDAHADSAV